MKNKNILIVDKDPSIISIFEFSLQDKGFHIFKLDYQIDSYPVLPSSIPNLDLIFIDQTIHINPSIEALDCVKAQYGDVPIILMAVSPTFVPHSNSLLPKLFVWIKSNINFSANSGSIL